MVFIFSIIVEMLRTKLSTHVVVDVKLYIKHMVSNRCKIAVKEELTKLGLHFNIVDLGEVEIMENISTEQRQHLQEC